MTNRQESVVLSSKLFLAAASVCLLSMPASAATVTDTFTGTVIANDGAYGDVTTQDTGNYFGGLSLVGASFTLTVTITPSTPIFYTEDNITPLLGYPYTTPNLMTSTLTINGHTFSWVEGTGQALGSVGAITPTDTSLQNFYLAPGTTWLAQQWYFDISPNTVPTDWSTPLAAMLVGSDFTYNGGAFYDQYGETLTLGVTTVNALASTPLPATLPLFATGLAGLGLLGWRRKKKAIAA